jgi:hypothetical protein
LLCELVSGTQPFIGESLHETLPRIGHAEPLALAELDSSLPAELQRIVGKCLAKDPTGWYQHADVLVVDLRSLALEVEKGTAVPLAASLNGAAGLDPPATATASRWPAAVTATLILVAISVGSISGWFLRQPGESPEGQSAHPSIDLPGPLDNSNVPQVPLAISPDGERIVFVIRRGVDTQLYSRELDAEGAVPIPGTEGGGHPSSRPTAAPSVTSPATRS